MKNMKNFKPLNKKDTFRRINDKEYIMYEGEHGLDYEAKRISDNTEELIARHINRQYDVDDNFIVFEITNREKRCYDKVLYSIKDNAIIDFLSEFNSVDPVFERVFSLIDSKQAKDINVMQIRTVMQIRAEIGDVTFYIALPNYELLPYAYSSIRGQMVDVRSVKELIAICNEDKEYSNSINKTCYQMGYDLKYAESDMHLLGKK